VRALEAAAAITRLMQSLLFGVAPFGSPDVRRGAGDPVARRAGRVLAAGATGRRYRCRAASKGE
jgi:hypothetical protein